MDYTGAFLSNVENDRPLIVSGEYRARAGDVPRGLCAPSLYLAALPHDMADEDAGEVGVLQIQMAGTIGAVI